MQVSLGNGKSLVNEPSNLLLKCLVHMHNYMYITLSILSLKKGQAKKQVYCKHIYEKYS